MSGGRSPLVIGSRGSKLALWQANWVKECLAESGHAARIEEIRTSGDRQQDRSLVAIGGKGVFVKEIEEALLAGRIDLAVHSLKDLPTAQPDGLAVTCIPHREDPRDLLVSRQEGVRLEDLPGGAVIGTGSPRRACQIRARRADLQIRDLRGNVDTRLKKLERDEYAAIVLACAGVRRLGLAVAGTPFEFDCMLPAVGQGALAIETRADDGALPPILAPLHHDATARAVRAERAFLSGLGGGCQAPVGSIGVIEGGRLVLRGLVGDPDSGRIMRDRLEGPTVDPERLGAELANRLLAQGAEALMRPRTPPPRADVP